MSIAALGSLAGGLSQGLERGLRIAGDQEDRRWQREQRERQKRLQTDADAEQAMLRAANEEGAAVLRRYQQEWQKQQPGPTMDGQPVQTNPFQLTPKMAMEAGAARTAKLLQLGGPTERWMQSFAQDEAMRAKMRGDAAQRVRQALTMGGDLTEPVGDFFETLSGSGKVAQVQRVAGPDGKQVVQIGFAGQQQPLTVPAEQFVADLDRMAANPADLAKHSLAMQLEAFKQGGGLARERARGEEDRKTEGVRQENRMSLAGVQGSTQRDVARIRAEGSGKSAKAEEIRALAQERTSVDNDVRTLVQQLKDARPTDRPAIQAQLEEARGRAADVRKRLAALSAGDTPSGTPGLADAAPSTMDRIMQDAEKLGLDTFDVELGGKRSRITRGGAPTAAAPATSASQPARPTTKAEYDALPSGAFYERDGRIYRKK